MMLVICGAPLYLVLIFGLMALTRALGSGSPALDRKAMRKIGRTMRRFR